MANTIVAIKRSSTRAEPSSLGHAEQAYSFESNKLFIGRANNSVEFIGGKVIVDKVANLESIIIDGTGDITTSSLRITGLANNSILISTSNGAVSALTGSPGQSMQIAANSTPFFGELDGGTF